MSESDFKAALPETGKANKALLRAALVKRVIYPFAPTENPQDWTAEVNGTIPLAIANENGGIFYFDPDDETSAHDGATVIVTADGKRYKVSNMVMPDAADGIGIDAPSGAEEIGTVYITSSAPDAEFAYWPDMLVMLTSRDWIPIEPRLGRPIYVKGDRHYFQNENGDWTPVFLPQGGQIRDDALVGGQRRYIVENQSTNAPPGAPSAGVYWIVGPSPTGDWAGYPGYIATMYDGDADWTLITPKSGDEAYDKATQANYVWNGTSWGFAGGAWGTIIHYRTEGSGSTTSTGSGSSDPISDAPTQSETRRTDDVTITTQVLSGKKIRFSYSAWVTFTNGVNSGVMEHVSVALFRDSDANAIRWKPLAQYQSLSNGSGITQTRLVEFSAIWETDDSASHEYKIAVMQGIGSSGYFTTVTFDRRDFMAEVSN